MLDRRGFIAETNATNCFFGSGGVVMTRRTVSRPEGITRAKVLDLYAEHNIPSRVDDLSLMETYRANEAFCMPGRVGWKGSNHGYRNAGECGSPGPAGGGAGHLTSGRASPGEQGGIR